MWLGGGVPAYRGFENHKEESQKTSTSVHCSEQSWQKLWLPFQASGARPLAAERPRMLGFPEGFSIKPRVSILCIRTGLVNWILGCDHRIPES